MKAIRLLKKLALVLTMMTGNIWATGASADTQDILGPLKAKGVDDTCKKMCMGNACKGKLVQAQVTYNASNPTVEFFGRCRLHNKHRNCTKVFGKKVCVDSYNYWVNVRLKAKVANCQVTGVNLSSSNELYKSAAAIASIGANLKILADGGTIRGCK